MIAPAFTRSSEWWEPKITLMIGLGLMVCYPYFGDMSLGIVGFLFQLILALVAGAVYVSLINDYTDLEEDQLAGKPNRLQKISPFSAYTSPNQTRHRHIPRRALLIS